MTSCRWSHVTTIQHCNYLYLFSLVVYLMTNDQFVKYCLIAETGVE